MADFQLSGNTVLSESGGTISWGGGAPAGTIVNIKQAVKNGTQQVTSTSYVLLSDLTINITPKSSNNKFLLEYHVNGNILDDANHGYLQLYRNGSAIGGAQGDSSGTDSLGSRTGATSVINTGTNLDGSQLTYSMKYLDSPSTTSQLTYAVYCKSSTGPIVYINRSGRDNNAATYDGRSISTLTVYEIAG
tara:strand:+ start:110 stop:679 length:570 start_codon:yes stop_codon:yes gene_type:complete